MRVSDSLMLCHDVSSVPNKLLLFGCLDKELDAVLHVICINCEGYRV